MSNKNAPPLTVEQLRFELAYIALWEPGTTVGLGRDANGNYFSIAARQAWVLWQAAQA